MTNNARTAADTGLPNDSKIDWPAIWVRVGEAAALLGLPEAEIAAVLAESDREAAVIGFSGRNDVSLDWLVLGAGLTRLSPRRVGGMIVAQEKTKTRDVMSDAQSRELEGLVARLSAEELRLLLVLAQVLAGRRE